jgi:isopentenyl diphosphate isomerase/L-lactate dehydrogenase-like FMN-dependent dehydrogenase
MPDDPSEPYGQNRQVEVFLAGMEGETPDLPVDYAGLEAEAKDALSTEAFDYVAGGAGEDRTVSANRRAFDRWQIVPRMLRDVEERDLSVDLLGQTLPVPFLLAPIGVQSIVHEEGELATARACADLDVPFVHSSAASETIEDVAEALGDATGWFQLYPSADRDVTASFLERAEAAGYEAIVLTLDTTMMGWRPRDVEDAYLPFLEGEGVANYLSDPAFLQPLDDPPEEEPRAAIMRFVHVFGDPSLDWDDLAFVREQTDLPLLLKGVLHPDDAGRAARERVDGVIVSNHGGRQVDGAIPALDALPSIVDAVGDDLAVLFDSGIRTGSDAIRAIALGAEAVLFGRPYAYGLAVDGQEGVAEVVSNFRADLDLTLGLSGQPSIADLDRSVLVEAQR